MVREKGALQVNFLIEADLMARVDAYWHNEQYKSRSVAIRELLAKALDLYDQGEEKLKRD